MSLNLKRTNITLRKICSFFQTFILSCPGFSFGQHDILELKYGTYFVELSKYDGK
ncbi:MAG: hypothetical protein VXY28_00360 [Bacteroidota bacterium]|nr:hypothetical protein [Bacteroidota bacterium]